MIRFFCAGVPRSMSVGTAFRFKRNGVERHIQGRRNTDWSTLVGEIGRAHAPVVPLTGPIVFSATFYLPRPQALAKKRNVVPVKRPDLDNLFHKLTDNWNGVFYLDDSQVVDVGLRKRYAGPDGRTGVEIRVEELSIAELEAEQGEMMSVAEGDAGRDGARQRRKSAPRARRTTDAPTRC